MLQRFLDSFVREGGLEVRGPDGVVRAAGPAPARVRAAIRDRATLWRILRRPGLAVGEAYVDGALTIERGELYEFLAICTRNLGPWVRRRRKRPWRSRPRNRRSAARRNAAHHYDLDGRLFELFLDDDWQYSCAYFPEPSMDLDAAQRAKKRHIAAKLLIEPGARVLDIGCGWGGLALSLAEDHGAEVLGVTLSREQLAQAQTRARQRRLEHKARFALQDYRDVEGVFDRIVSVGMFEHVGPAHYAAFFDTLAQRLAQDGVALLHTIGRADAPGPGNAWIEKHIFPGGTIPSLSQIVAASELSGLMVTDVEVLREHYAETLRAWRRRFQQRRDQARALYDERFCRMWEFYLAGAEAGFREGDLVVFQLQLAKDRHTVPQTRDYITDFDRASGHSAQVAAE